MFQQPDDDLKLEDLAAAAPPPEVNQPPAMPGFDPAALSKAEDDARSKRSMVNLVGGIGDSLANRQGFGNFFLGKMAPENHAASTFAKTVSDNIESPTARQQKLYEAMTNAKKMKDTQRDDAYSTALEDPNSKESMALKGLAGRWGVQATPEMKGSEILRIIDPKQMMETEAKAKVDFANQKAIHQMDNDASIRKFILEQGIKDKEKKEEKAKPSEKQVEAMTDLDNATNELNNIVGMLGDKSSWTGSVDGRIPDMMIGSDQVAWRSALGKYKDAYRKAVTGAGASLGEIARLESRLPSETDTYANFVAKAQEAIKELQTRKSTLSSNYQKMGKNVAAFTPQSSEENKSERKLVETQKNKKTGEIRYVYSDGSVEMAPKTAGN